MNDGALGSCHRSGLSSVLGPGSGTGSILGPGGGINSGPRSRFGRGRGLRELLS